jgi:hypothetical protein
VDIAIRVEASDGLHEEWKYRNSKTGSRYYRARSGKTETVNVYLRKTPWHKGTIWPEPPPVAAEPPELDFIHFQNEALEPPSPNRWDLRSLGELREGVILTQNEVRWTPELEHTYPGIDLAVYAPGPPGSPEWFPLVALVPTPDSITQLYKKFVQRSETDSVAMEMAQLAEDNPAAREYLAGRLPALIIDQLPRIDPRTANVAWNPVWNPVWVNAVRLTGQLKLVAAIPALKMALSEPPLEAYDHYYGATTTSTMARLGLDIVARALADIGDPSVPTVARILSKGDFNAKRRAMWILLNIDSPAAKKAMADDLPHERNPQMKEWIQSTLSGEFQYNLK